MQLTHPALLKKIPPNILTKLHKEVCQLRGKAWGAPHKYSEYVFKYPPYYLYLYHILVIAEMQRRGLNVAVEWRKPLYRGKQLPSWTADEFGVEELSRKTIFPEHDQAYLDTCVDALAGEGISV